ncbi:unnamed protein product [Owenia fusiformis]|uniref:C-type lectin domain-containing protein n=1 Tax=Owenia fusiformis TaxID=6347 RepID=A0A8S4N165_OWEFU|nr:unnamed protein product [Owenia fusiformis]
MLYLKVGLILGFMHRCNSIAKIVDGYFGDTEACPGGYTIWSSWCYILDSDPNTFSMKNWACTQNNDVSVSISSQDEDNFIKGLIGSTIIWIGLRDDLQEGDFAWSDGTFLNYTNWATDNPRTSPDGDDLDCVVLSNNFVGWQNINCDNSSHGILCKRDAIKTDGAWTAWSAWSSCISECGEGQSERRRSCTNPAPSGGGNTCSGESQESRKCESNDKCQKLGTLFKAHREKKLVSHTYHTLTAHGLAHCAIVCHQDTACRSFNIDNTQKYERQCELNDKNRLEFSSDFHTSSKHDYYDTTF